MSETSYEQGRRHPRFRRGRPVVVDGSAERGCRYLLLDVVSRAGGELVCGSKLTPGEVVELEICLSGGVIRVRARVIDCRGAPGDYRIGVEFLVIGDDDDQLLTALLADRD
jgi:hypothetical protein